MAGNGHGNHDFIDPKVIARLAGLGLHARMPMLGNVSGRHRSPISGSSLEFASYRKYVPGDDTRRMDWRAWGRSDRYYIKEFEADTNLRLCLIVDTSGSLGFAMNGISKLDYMKSLAGTLAYLTARQGDAVGLYCADRAFHTEIPPRRNPVHLRVVLDKLAELKATGETGLAGLLARGGRERAATGVVVVVSDLFIDPAVLRDCFQHLKFRKHDVAVFHLLDQSEIEFDFDRPMRFVDLEGAPPILADPSLMGKLYRDAITAYLDELGAVMREAAVDYQRINLGDPVDQVLSRFLVRRAPKQKK